MIEEKGNLSRTENLCLSPQWHRLLGTFKGRVFLAEQPVVPGRTISLSEGPWGSEVSTRESFLPSSDVEHILLLFLRERGIIGQIINNNPPLLPLWQVLDYGPRSLETK